MDELAQGDIATDFRRCGVFILKKMISIVES